MGLDLTGNKLYSTSVGPKGEVLKQLSTDGLALHLDSGNKNSYGGSGTTWTDLSGNSNTGTLTNGPTYNSSNQGSIVFDGTNDYISLPSNIFSTFSSSTISVWANPVTLTTKGMFLRFLKDSNNQAVFEIENSRLHYAILTGGSWAPDGYSSVASVVANTWQNFVVTVNSSSGWKLYINGTQNGSGVQTNTFSVLGTTQNYYIGYAVDGGYGSGRPFDGKIASVLVYNRTLSSTEITQNYNIQKSRFGL